MTGLSSPTTLASDRRTNLSKIPAAASTLGKPRLDTKCEGCGDPLIEHGIAKHATLHDRVR